MRERLLRYFVQSNHFHPQDNGQVYYIPHRYWTSLLIFSRHLRCRELLAQPFSIGKKKFSCRIDWPHRFDKAFTWRMTMKVTQSNRKWRYSIGHSTAQLLLEPNYDRYWYHFRPCRVLSEMKILLLSSSSRSTLSDRGFINNWSNYVGELSGEIWVDEVGFCNCFTLGT